MEHCQEFDWYDVRDFGIEGKGWLDTECYFDRLPASAKGMVREPVWNLSRSASGMSCRFETDAPTIRAKWKLRDPMLNEANFPRAGFSGLDLYIHNEARWRWAGATVRFDSQDAEDAFVEGIPEGSHLCHVNLPLRNPVDALSIGVPKGARFQPVAPRSTPPIVYYGTSIVHGAYASRPGMVNAAIVARKVDKPMINLGFSGNARMEIEMAELLAELTPSIYIFDPLPNMSAELVAERGEAFFERIYAAHPSVPIVMVEDRTFCNAWIRSGVLSAHKARRMEWRKVFANLTKAGRPVQYLQGENLFGSDGEASPDGSHPTDLGSMRMAEQLVPVVEAAFRQIEPTMPKPPLTPPGVPPRP